MRARSNYVGRECSQSVAAPTGNVVEQVERHGAAASAGAAHAPPRTVLWAIVTATGTTECRLGAHAREGCIDDATLWPVT